MVVSATLSAVILCETSGKAAVATLASLVSGVTAGLLSDVILLDRIGTGDFAKVADVAGCQLMTATGSRGAALAAGAAATRAPWLLFLQAGMVLDSGWAEETDGFIQRMTLADKPKAALFRRAASPYDDAGLAARAATWLRILAGRGDEPGLVIARSHYTQAGGHADHASRPEAELRRRLGRSRIATLRNCVSRV